MYANRLQTFQWIRNVGSIANPLWQMNEMNRVFVNIWVEGMLDDSHGDSFEALNKYK